MKKSKYSRKFRTLSKQVEAIEEFAQDKTCQEVANKFNSTKSAAYYFKLKNQTRIELKRTELQELRNSILAKSLIRLDEQVDKKKIPANILISLIKELFNQIQITNNRPTTISKKQDYGNMGREELEEEYKKLLNRAKEIQKDEKIASEPVITQAQPE